MTHTFKVGEPQITRGGQEAVIFSLNGIGDWSILGAVVLSDGTHLFHFWNTSGELLKGVESNNDLMPPVPKKHKQVVWFNAYRTFDDKIYLEQQSDELQAKSSVASNRISTFSREIEFEEGEGL